MAFGCLPEAELSGYGALRSNACIRRSSSSDCSIVVADHGLPTIVAQLERLSCDGQGTLRRKSELRVRPRMGTVLLFE